MVFKFFIEIVNLILILNILLEWVTFVKLTFRKQLSSLISWGDISFNRAIVIVMHGWQISFSDLIIFVHKVSQIKTFWIQLSIHYIRLLSILNAQLGIFILWAFIYQIWLNLVLKSWELIIKVRILRNISLCEILTLIKDHLFYLLVWVW